MPSSIPCSGPETCLRVRSGSQRRLLMLISWYVWPSMKVISGLLNIREVFGGIFICNINCRVWHSNDVFYDLYLITLNLYCNTQDPKFMERTLKQQGMQPVETLEVLKKALVDEFPQSFEDCVAWARLQFQEHYYNTIAQLLFNFPSNQVTHYVHLLCSQINV